MDADAANQSRLMRRAGGSTYPAPAPGRSSDRQLERAGFAAEQQPFPLQSGGEAADAATASDDAVARDKHRDGIGSAGGADRPQSFGTADGAGYLGVGPGSAQGNLPQGLPDELLEFRPGREIQRRERLRGFAGQCETKRSGGFRVPPTQLSGNGS